MKRILLSLSILATLTLSAQPVLEISLDSPSSGDNITAGAAFDFDVTISNTGNQNHLGTATGDTVIYYPLFNGQLLGSSGGGVVAWYYDPAISSSGNGSDSKSLNIQGGSSGSLEICAGMLYFGSSYSSATLGDTSSTCANVNYAAMNISELRLTETFDNSFYNSNIYFVQVSSRVDLINPSIELVDISGRLVKQTSLNANGGEINQEISMADLPAGIYIVRLKTDKGLISINKIMKQ